MTIAPEAEVNPNQKGSELSGGLLTEEAFESADLLAKKRGGGAQQYYTPRPAAELIARVIGKESIVFDPTAGDGSLLVDFHPDRSYGVELDADQVKNAEHSYKAIQGDIQHVYTLLRRTLTFDAVVANPPFGLKWQEETLNDGKETNSALLTLMMATRLIDEDDGQLAFVCGAGRWRRSIADKPDARGIYAVIEVEDLFPGTQTPAVICFGFHPSKNLAEGFERRERKAGADTLDLLDRWVTEARDAANGYRWSSYHSGYRARETSSAWPKIEAEYKRRRDDRLKSKTDREYDVQMFGGGNLDISPSPFVRLVLDKMGKLRNLEKMHGLSTDYFVQNERDWNFIKGLQADELITVDPKLDDKVATALHKMHRVLCPLYPLRKVQRLAFLSDVDSLLCTKSDPEKGFDAGIRYELTTSPRSVQRSWVQAYQIKQGKRAGEWEDRKYTKRYTVLQITVGHVSFDDTEEDAQSIKWLIDHFELPDPGDVSTRFPEEVNANRVLLREIEAEMIEAAREWDEKNNIPEHKRFEGFRKFQIEDLARMLVKEDGLLSWEQGLGKTIGAIAWFKAQVKRGIKEQLLVVCPKDLIDQWQRESERFLGQRMTLINSHGQAHAVTKKLLTGASGLYVTYHEALSLVGTRRSIPAKEVIVEERTEEKPIPKTGGYGYWKLDETGQKVKATSGEYYAKIRNPECEGEVGYGPIPQRFKIVTRQITSKELCPQCKADHKSGWNGTFCEAPVRAGNGEQSVCGYAHWGVRVKPISSRLSVAFRKGAIVLDEATMIGGSADGGDSLRSKSFRGLRAKRKLAMTGTPIKNYIIQLYWPLWFALGNMTPRFPYTYTSRGTFLKDFAVEQVARDRAGKQVSVCYLPEITNLSRFWRMIASSTIRRRVEDTGEQIVPIHYYDVTAPLGKGQQKRIDMWAKTFGVFFKEEHPESKCTADWANQMQMLLGGIPKNEYAELMPCADPHKDWRPDDAADPLGTFADYEISNFTPAVVRSMEIVMALVKDGRKVLVGSPLVKSSRFIAEALQEKGVHAIHILTDSDQTQKPEDRAETVFDFQTNEVDVLCTGVQAIRFGHNLDAASAVVLLGFPWDFETLDQFVKRVRRLTSQKPIDVFCVMPGIGTVTAKKWDLLQKKSDTSSLALDGRIIEKNEIEIDKDQILAELIEKGVPATGDEVDESDVQTAWESIPHLDEYVAPEGLIPTPPAPLPVLHSEVNRDLLVELHEAVLARPTPPFQPFATAEQAGSWPLEMHYYTCHRWFADVVAPAVGEFFRGYRPPPPPPPVEAPSPPSDDMAALMEQMKQMQEQMAALMEQNTELKQKLTEPTQLTLEV
jgi:N-6 DNA methylase/SNF2 domain-containing protein/helicase-like protein